MAEALTNTNQTPSEIIVKQDITIPNGESLSGFIRFKQTTFVGIIMPAAWTAASLTFQASIDDSTFVNLFDIFDNEVIHLVNANRYIEFDPSIFASVRAIKVRSGTSAAAVNQGAARVIQILSRPL